MRQTMQEKSERYRCVNQARFTRSISGGSSGIHI